MLKRNGETPEQVRGGRKERVESAVVQVEVILGADTAT